MHYLQVLIVQFPLEINKIDSMSIEKKLEFHRDLCIDCLDKPMVDQARMVVMLMKDFLNMFVTNQEFEITFSLHQSIESFLLPNSWLVYTRVNID